MPKSKNSPASLSALRVPYLPHMRPAGPFGLAGAFPTLGARACRSDAKLDTERATGTPLDRQDRCQPLRWRCESAAGSDGAQNRHVESAVCAEHGAETPPL